MKKTSEQYTDLSFITTDLGIGSELATVFNNLAIERLTEHAGNLLVAPLCFKKRADAGDGRGDRGETHGEGRTHHS